MNANECNTFHINYQFEAPKLRPVLPKSIYGIGKIEYVIFRMFNKQHRYIVIAHILTQQSTFKLLVTLHISQAIRPAKPSRLQLLAQGRYMIFITFRYYL